MDGERAVDFPWRIQPRTGVAHPDQIICWLASRQHGVVARRQLLELGLTARQVQLRIGRGLLHPMLAGVYAVGHRSVSREVRWLAAVLAAGSGAVLSHDDAGAHWGIRRLTGGPAAIHVTVSRGLHSRRGLTVHRGLLSPSEWTVRGRIPVTTPVRTLLDLATQLRPAALQRAVHEAEVQRLCRPASLRAALALHPGMRGAQALKEILSMGGGRALPTRSELEDRFLRFLAGRRLPMPETNQVVRTDRGSFEVDCIWRDADLVVELDGSRFHGTVIAKERDALKDRALAAVGLAVMHVTWSALDREADELESDVRSAVARGRRVRDRLRGT